MQKAVGFLPYNMSLEINQVSLYDRGRIVTGGGGGGSTPIVLTGTLEAGETEITFTDSRILEYSMVDIFVLSDEEIAPTDKDSSVANTITLTFDAQAEDLFVGLLIFNLVTPPSN